MSFVIFTLLMLIVPSCVAVCVSYVINLCVSACEWLDKTIPLEASISHKDGGLSCDITVKEEPRGEAMGRAFDALLMEREHDMPFRGNLPSMATW